MGRILWRRHHQKRPVNHVAMILRSHGYVGHSVFVNMAESMPVFPKAATILLRTGNIVNWDRLKRKLNQNPTEEVDNLIF